MVEFHQGTLLAGRYRLDRELGRGGMGEVWAAQDEKLRRQVAVKLMTERVQDSEQALSRFEREAMAVARVRSPHIVEVHDYGIDDGCPYIVMEMLEGMDLKALLKKERRLTLERAAPILLQVAKALQAAHAARIVHRDLKPANVFLASEHGDTIAKVFDFGVAKAQIGEDTDATAEGVLLGTPRYMSPEQAYGAKQVDHRSDLWSLGVIAYQCITGKLPFVAPGQGHVLVKICTEDPQPPSELLPYLGPETDAFFVRALAKKAEDRFQTAMELAHAFAKLANVSIPSSLEAAIAGPMPFDDDPLDAVAQDLSGRYLDPTKVEGSGSRDRSDLSGTLPSPEDSLLSNPTSADTPFALRSSGGTLGPATRTLDEPRGWLSRSSRVGVVLAALAVGGGLVFAATRSSEPDAPSEGAAQGAAAQVQAAEPPDEPTATPAPEVAPDVSADDSPAEPSKAATEASAKPATPRTKSAKPASKVAAKSPATPPTKAPEPEPAKEAAKEPAKPEPKKGSKDGLDLFNKRW